MKTRKLYQIRSNNGSIGNRLRSIEHARRAIKTCKKLGINARMAPVAVNAQEFDGFGRRIHAVAKVDLYTGLKVAA